MPDPFTNPRQFVGSRWKGVAGVLGSIGFIMLGWWLAKSTGTSRYPAPVAHVAGWIAVLIFGFFLPFWAASVLKPHRLSIEDDGFRVKQALRSEKYYRWEHIERIWVSKEHGGSLVVWEFTRDFEGKPRFKWGKGYDAGLPGGWQTSPEHLAIEMDQVRASFGQRG